MLVAFEKSNGNIKFGNNRYLKQAGWLLKEKSQNYAITIGFTALNCKIGGSPEDSHVQIIFYCHFIRPYGRCEFSILFAILPCHGRHKVEATSRDLFVAGWICSQ